MLWVTLYCDASFSQEHGGAWGVWLRSEYGRIIKNGKCPPEVTDSLLAEFYAAEVGVRLAREEWQADGIQVNSDCDAVVRGLGPYARPSSRAAVCVIQNRIRALGGRIRTKHVKAHTGGQDTRSWINRRVDKMANHARKACTLPLPKPLVKPKEETSGSHSLPIPADSGVQPEPHQA